MSRLKNIIATKMINKDSPEKEVREKLNIKNKVKNFKKIQEFRKTENIILEDKNKTYAYAGMIGTSLSSFLILLKIVNWFYYTMQPYQVLREKSLISDLMIAIKSPIPFILILILSIYLGGLMKEYILNKSLNENILNGFEISKNNTHGSSSFMSLEEFQQRLEFHPIKEPKNIIFGKLGNQAVCLKDKPIGKELNRNMLVLGGTGTGKSASMLIPLVYQAIMQGESIVVADAKGEIYRETIAAAKKMGYKTKIFNVEGTNFKNSDGWDCMKDIRELNDSEAMSATDRFITMCIENTTGTKDSDTYWVKMEQLLLKAMLLYIGRSESFIPIDEKGEYILGLTLEEKNKYRNIGQLIDHLALISMSDLLSEIMAGEEGENKVYDPKSLYEKEKELMSDSEKKKLPRQIPYTDACYQQFKTLMQSDKNTSNVYQSLGTRLKMMQNPDIRKMLSTDEINLADVGKEKCIYYLVVSVQHQTYSFLSSLFIESLNDSLIKLCSKKQTKEEGKIDVKTTYVLDEFRNIGRIPNFTQKISTLRGYNISIVIGLQDITQLQTMYKEEWETICSSCAYQIFLGGSSPTTLKYVKALCGVTTVETENTNKTISAFSVTRMSEDIKIGKGESKRDLMTEDELRTIDPFELILVIDGLHPKKLKKYYYKDHPYANLPLYDNYGNLIKGKLMPSDHIPAWMQNENDEIINNILYSENNIPAGTNTKNEEILNENTEELKGEEAVENSNKATSTIDDDIFNLLGQIDLQEELTEPEIKPTKGSELSQTYEDSYTFEEEVLPMQNDSEPKENINNDTNNKESVNKENAHNTNKAFNAANDNNDDEPEEEPEEEPKEIENNLLDDAANNAEAANDEEKPKGPSKKNKKDKKGKKGKDLDDNSNLDYLNSLLNGKENINNLENVETEGANSVQEVETENNKNPLTKEEEEETSSNNIARTSTNSGNRYNKRRNKQKKHDNNKHKQNEDKNENLSESSSNEPAKIPENQNSYSNTRHTHNKKRK